MTLAEKISRAKADLDKAYGAGRRAEYDRMWDVVQPEGITNYAPIKGMFNGKLWNYYNFYPKRDIRPVGDASFMFYDWESSFPGPDLDLKQRLTDCGVTLDTSLATDLSSMFSFSGKLTAIPTIDCSSLSKVCSNVFARTWNLKTVDKIIVNEQITFSNWFDSAVSLRNITFEGSIGQSLDMHWSTLLTASSLRSIVNALSAAASGQKLSLSMSAVNNAFTEAEWDGLVNTRTNWTISLV